MSYSTVIHIEVVTLPAQVSAVSNHNLRSNPPLNADVERKQINIVLKGGGRPTGALLDERLKAVKAEPRKNSPLMFTLILSAGEPFFKKKDVRGWAREALDLLEELFGADNVLDAIVHLDEAVPHMHAGVAALTRDGEMSMHKIFEQHIKAEPLSPAGKRFHWKSGLFYRTIQRRYYELCSRSDPDLSEPVPYGKAKHQDVSVWRELCKQSDFELSLVPEVSVAAPGPLDYVHPSVYAKRQVTSDRQKCAPIHEVWRAKAIQSDTLRRQVAHLERTVRRLDAENREKDQALVEYRELVLRLLDRTDANWRSAMAAFGLPVHEVDRAQHKYAVIGLDSEIRVCRQTSPDGPLELPDDAAPGTLASLAAILGLPEDDRRAWVLAKLGIEEALNARLCGLRRRLKQELEETMKQPLSFSLEEMTGLQPVLPRDLNAAVLRHTGLDLEQMQRSVPGYCFLGSHGTNLAIVRCGLNGAAEGIAVCGLRIVPLVHDIFAQYLGSFQNTPFELLSPRSPLTIVVSNPLEALVVSKLASYPLAVIATGVTPVDALAEKLALQPTPILLISYTKGLRRTRSRALADALRRAGANYQCLSPHDLGLSDPGLEFLLKRAREDGEVAVRCTGMFANWVPPRPAGPTPAQSLAAAQNARIGADLRDSAP